MRTYSVAGIIIGIIGYAIVFIETNFITTLGVLLVVWGNNLESKKNVLDWCSTLILRDKIY